MGKIRLLPDHIASQVAAGEVVERPASVVKELVENSLDAGAKRIEVDFAGGGASLIRVRDDGIGMDREDALMSLERHATSKLRDGEGLSAIRTLGFRGEALPSIASVSRFRLVTREQRAPAGVEITVSGGKIETVRDSGEAPGTLVEVRSLFYNVPARRKFLRSESTESAHIIHYLHTLALLSPGTAFLCRKDGRELWQLPAATSVAVRIRDLFGPEVFGRLEELSELETDGIRFRGFIARPDSGWQDRGMQFFFINGRAATHPVIPAALRETRDKDGRNRYIPAILFIDLPPSAVDCNVHPAKKEVRFAQPARVREALAAFLTPRPATAPRTIFSLPSSTASSAQKSTPSHSTPLFQTAEPLLIDPEKLPPPPTQDETAEPTPEEESSQYRALGAFSGDYGAYESPDGLVLIHIPSALRRIHFETLLRRMRAGEVVTQRLLIPAIVELSPRETEWILRHIETLRAIGLEIDSFGAQSIRVEGLPPFLSDQDPQTVLHRIANDLRESGRNTAHKLEEEKLARCVCALIQPHAEGEDLRRLMDDLLRCDLPYASPEGRPTMLLFSHAELRRKFGFTA